MGAFADAYEKLCTSGLDEAVRRAVKSGKPVMGICLGMQLLFERSFEYGEHPGLGLLGGEVVGMEGRLPSGLPIPHIGWNALKLRRPGGVLKYVKEGDCVYFVHSFYADNCPDSTTATTEYGIDLTASVQRENLYGCQFHPEKSGEAGLRSALTRRITASECGTSAWRQASSGTPAKRCWSFPRIL